MELLGAEEVRGRRGQSPRPWESSGSTTGLQPGDLTGSGIQGKEALRAPVSSSLDSYCPSLWTEAPGRLVQGLSSPGTARCTPLSGGVRGQPAPGSLPEVPTSPHVPQAV